MFGIWGKGLDLSGVRGVGGDKVNPPYCGSHPQKDFCLVAIATKKNLCLFAIRQGHLLSCYCVGKGGAYSEFGVERLPLSDEDPLEILCRPFL